MTRNPQRANWPFSGGTKYALAMDFASLEASSTHCPTKTRVNLISVPSCIIHTSNRECKWLRLRRYIPRCDVRCVMTESAQKVSKFTYKTRKRVAGANPPLSSPAPSPPPAAAAPATPQPAPPEAAPAPSFIGVEILPFCGTRPAGIAPSTPGKANNRPWTHKKITKSLSITPSVLQQLLTTCDTAYQPRSADDDVPVAKTALPFRWDSDTEHECALLCFDTDLVADLVRGRDLHDHANLNRFAYGLYHVAQSSKRRVAARAKAASAKMMSQKLVPHPPSTPLYSPSCR